MPNKVVKTNPTASTIVKQNLSSDCVGSTELLISNISSLCVSSGASSLKTRKYAPAKDIKPGELIFKPTFDNGVKVEGVGRRPHLVIDNKKDSETGRTILTIADMSTLNGKEHKLILGGNNYLINPEDPSFTGKYMSFVKLNKVATLDLKSSQNQILWGRIVNDFDVNFIRRILGFD